MRGHHGHGPNPEETPKELGNLRGLSIGCIASNGPDEDKPKAKAKSM